MINETTAQKPLVLRILQYPLTGCSCSGRSCLC